MRSDCGCRVSRLGWMQYADGKAYSVAAADTGILPLSKSSRRRWLSSVNLLSLSSAMLCFFLLSPTGRDSYGVDAVPYAFIVVVAQYLVGRGETLRTPAKASVERKEVFMLHAQAAGSLRTAAAASWIAPLVSRPCRSDSLRGGTLTRTN